MKKEILLELLSTSLGNCFFYDRRHDESLNRRELFTMINRGELTVEDVLEHTREWVTSHFPSMETYS